MLQYAYRTHPPPTQRTRTHADWILYQARHDSIPIRWPGDAHVALWVCPNILHYEFAPPDDPWIASWSRVPAPDVMMYSRQDFANRVGFWRVLKILDKFNVRCTAVTNAEALLKNISIRDAAVERSWAYLGHGINNTRFVTGMSETQEASYYRQMRDIVYEQTGVIMKGTGGPGPQSANEQTPDVLAKLGFVYHADWFLDDVPTPIQVHEGSLVSLPYATDLNDASMLGSAFEAEDYVDANRRHFDVLAEEGKTSGKVMCLSIHPALMGQAHRAKYLEELLEYLYSRPNVWFATGDEIADYFVQHYADDSATTP